MIRSSYSKEWNLFGNKLFLLEIHNNNCTCTYCKGCDMYKLHFGLNIPHSKKGGWYVIKYWKRSYIRFILPKWICNLL